MPKVKKEEKQQDSIFDHFARLGRPMGEPEKKDPVSVETLLARIEAQDRQLAALTKTEPSYPMVAQTPAQQPQGQQYQVDASKLRVNLDGLPDQTEDPQGYAQGYTERVNAAITAQAHAVQQNLMAKAERDRAGERLWNGFKAAHPEWAPYESLVETVANRVTNDLTTKGVDLQRYMLGSPEKFYEDIAGALQQQYGKLVDKGEEDDEDDTETDPGDSSRVQGLGSDGTPAARGKKTGVGQEKGSDMFDDLKAVQKRMGLI